MAAVLASGADSAICSLSAGAHLGITRRRQSAIDVVCPRALRPRGPIRPHRFSLQADELTIHDAIPTTTVARTLLDLAAVLDRHALERAMNEAEVQRLTSSVALPTLLQRHPRRPGAGSLREILALETLGVDVTLSELEDLLLALVDEAHLPRPRTNAAIELPTGTIVVDCLWMPQRVVLELDGERFHGTSRRRRQDRARDRDLAAAGYLPLRAGWHDLHGGRADLIRQLRATLGLSVSSGS